MILFLFQNSPIKVGNAGTSFTDGGTNQDPKASY